MDSAWYDSSFAPQTPMWERVLVCFLFILCSFIASALGGIGMRGYNRGWYDVLKPPLYCPPKYVFGPVWTVLYVMIGLSAFFIWKQYNAVPQEQQPFLDRSSGSSSTSTYSKHRNNVEYCLTIWAVQLALNGLWPWLFFGLRMMLAAFVEMTVLWFMILLCIYKFWSVSIVASILFVPYALWVTFAMYLNGAYYFLNEL
eukprot:Lankesteria_metandrocarpae@DN1841_c0_g1_i1.p2